MSLNDMKHAQAQPQLSIPEARFGVNYANSLSIVGRLIWGLAVQHDSQLLGPSTHSDTFRAARLILLDFTAPHWEAPFAHNRPDWDGATERLRHFGPGRWVRPIVTVLGLLVFSIAKFDFEDIW